MVKREREGKMGSGKFNFREASKFSAFLLFLVVMPLMITLIISSLALVSSQTAQTDVLIENPSLTLSSPGSSAGGSATVTFELSNKGNQDVINAKWSVIVYDANVKEIMGKSDSIASLVAGQKASIKWDIDFSDPSLNPNTMYYIVIASDPFDDLNESSEGNNFVGDDGFVLNYWNNPSVVLNGLSGLSFSTPTSQASQPQPYVPSSINFENFRVLSGGPGTDWILEFDLNSSISANVCFNITRYDFDGKFTGTESTCPKSLVLNQGVSFNTLDAKSHQDDVLVEIVILDSSTGEEYGRTSSSLQTPTPVGDITVLSHTSDLVNGNLWITIEVENNYPPALDASIRLSVGFYDDQGVLLSTENSGFKKLFPGANTLTFSFIVLPDEKHYEYTLSDGGINLLRINNFIGTGDIPSQETKPNPFSQNNLVAFAVPMQEISAPHGNLNSVKLGLNDLNSFNLAFLEHAIFDSATIQCISQNADKWFAYELDGNLKGSNLVLVSSQSLFSSGSVGVVAPQGTGCTLSGEIDPVLAEKYDRALLAGTSTSNGTHITVTTTGTLVRENIQYDSSGLYAVPVQPYWHGYVAENLGLCTGNTVLNSVLAVEAGTTIDIRGEPFDFGATAQPGSLLGATIYAECA